MLNLMRFRCVMLGSAPHVGRKSPTGGELCRDTEKRSGKEEFSGSARVAEFHDDQAL